MGRPEAGAAVGAEDGEENPFAGLTEPELREMAEEAAAETISAAWRGYRYRQVFQRMKEALFQAVCHVPRSLLAHRGCLLFLGSLCWRVRPTGGISRG